jgi:D-alanyl-D-alanine carboxypeptidase (penicillin-binding protein 5/6)
MQPEAPPPPSRVIYRRRRIGAGAVLLAVVAGIGLILFVSRGEGEPRGPDVAVPAYVVFDGASRRVLAVHNPDDRRPVGSIVKLMTAHVVLEAGNPGRRVSVPPIRLAEDETSVELRQGEVQRRDVLTRAMLIASAGDAASALAKDVAGTPTAFVARMNDAAREMDLDDTAFKNPNGLDAAGQYSSARDVTDLAIRLMRRPQVRATVSRGAARLHGRSFAATNDLLGVYRGADGVKTGHTDEAGWCIAASARRGGRRIFVTVLGAPTREARARAVRRLLDWGFSQAS